jgi:hypothetical protein
MMRAVNWLFIVSVLLFISGIGLVIASARTARTAAPAEAVAVKTTPVASVKQIMAAITGPAANVIYQAVSTSVSVRGIEEVAPRNDDEWAAVGNSAAVLAESANLMMTDGRAIDQGDWMKFSQQLVERSRQALKAADAKSADGILEAGGPINETCDNCHAKYQRQ